MGGKEEVNEDSLAEEEIKELHFKYFHLAYNLCNAEFYNETEGAIMQIEEKLKSLGNKLIDCGYTGSDLEGLRNDAYKNAHMDYKAETRNEIKISKGGDIIKTAWSPKTLVLKVESDNALLFDGEQFVVAHGIQKEGDNVFWGDKGIITMIYQKIHLIT